jgi:hypothetical protein
VAFESFIEFDKDSEHEESTEKEAEYQRYSGSAICAE